MYTATAGIVLPTTITGSLPRPGWYTENLGRRNFREAMVDRTYREQYLDAASAYIRDQEIAGLDIVTDGDCRFDADVGGHNWFSYAPIRMDGFAGAQRLPHAKAARPASCTRAATSCTTSSRRASCPTSSARSAAERCSTPRSGRRRSA